MNVIFDNVSNKTAVVINQAIAMSLNTNKLQVVPRGRTTIKFIFLGEHPEEKPHYVDLWVNHICQLVSKEGFPLNYEIDNKTDTITFKEVLNDTKAPVHKRRVRKNK